MKPPHPKILVGAQFWAYGPAGKANAIAHVLAQRGHQADFVGGQTSLHLSKNAGHYKRLHHVEQPDAYAQLPDYDIVVSVMDPYLALWAYQRSIPVFYVDSMSWFWRWRDVDEAKILGLVEAARTLGFQAACQALHELEPDARQLFAHAVADRILGQGAPQTTATTTHKAENVGAVIDLKYRAPRPREHIIISLSGGLSPATDLEAATAYAHLVLDLMADATRNWPFIKSCILTGHEAVIGQLKSVPEHIKPTALDQPAFLDALNGAAAVFCPCGFTTVYEALAYGAPVGFLPENHNGHAYEYLIITDGLQPGHRADVFPHTLLTLDQADLSSIAPIDQSMRRIGQAAADYWRIPHARQQHQSIVASWKDAFVPRERILARQRDQVRNVIPTFDGARRVAERVLGAVG